MGGNTVKKMSAAKQALLFPGLVLMGVVMLAAGCGEGLNGVGKKSGQSVEAGTDRAESLQTGERTQAERKKRGDGDMIEEHRSGVWTPGLSEEERGTLFAIAEDTLRWCVAGERTPFSFDKYELNEKLKQPMATFVTLKIGGMLRGCIGSLAPMAALYQSVHDNTVNAAMNDYRFSPVRARELDRIEIHISILSPIVDIESIDEFHPGEHGIIIEKAGRRAVYLPEVAVEQNWDKAQTLSSLSQKAGLPVTAWKEGARFKVFSSVSLSRK